MLSRRDDACPGDDDPVKPVDPCALIARARRLAAEQTAFAKKVFDIAIRGAQETAQLNRMSTSDAVKMLRDRMRESLEEIRGHRPRR